MKRKVFSKVTAVLLCLAMLMAIMPAALADGYAVTISDVIKDESGAVTGANVTVSESGTYTLYAAVYSSGVLDKVVKEEFTESGTVTLDESLTVNTITQTLRLYAWDENLTPAAEPYEVTAKGFTAAFAVDEHVKIIVSDTQSFDGEVSENASEAVARDGSTGEIKTDGTGQVNFKVVLDEGYEIAGISITKGTYNNLKKTDADTYRVTKLTADTTITITTALSSELTPYTAAFETDEHVTSITVSETDNFDIASLVTENAETAAARDGDGGYILSDGNGQINFVVNVEDGYQVASVTATDGAYKNIKTPVDTGVTNGYRLTKIKDNLVIYVTTELIPETTGDGVIHLNGDSIDAAGVEGATVSAATLTLAASEDAYKIEGTLTDGNIVVAKNAGDVTLEFVDDVSITSSAAAISAKTGANITLTADSGKKASFTSSAKKAIDGNGDIVINGDGEIEAITTSQKNAIGGNTVTISGSGTVTVNSQKHGIEGAEGVAITGTPTVNITSLGDGIRSDSAPEIDAAAGTVASTASVMGGTVTINGGTVSITATSYVDETSLETKTGDGIQADKTLTVGGGNITINAAGEAMKASFNQLDLQDASDYSSYESALSSYNGCVYVTGGTVTATAGEDGVKAVKDITVSGGSVTVTSAGDDGLQAGDVVINSTTPSASKRNDGTVTVSDSGAVTVSSAAGDGIITTLEYRQTGGSVTLYPTKDGIQAGKAYTALDIGTGSDDDTILYETNGIVNITGGNLTIDNRKGKTYSFSSSDSEGNTTLTKNGINYSCKGIKARKLVDISDGNITVDTLDDAVHSNHTLNISGGTVTADSYDDGIHGEYYLNISGTADVTVGRCYEGIEASKVYISGGTTRILDANDDGANAAGDEPSDSAITLDSVYSLSASDGDVTIMAGPGDWGHGGGMNDNTANYGYMEVSGGVLYIEAAGDGFDSNGDALISGGYVFVNGPENGGNGVFDVGDNNNTLTITGGTVIGAGAYDQHQTVYPTQTTNSQAYIYTTSGSGSAGSAIEFTDNSGTYQYIAGRKYTWVFVSTPNMTSGTSYTLKYNGTASGGEWLYNFDTSYGLKSGASYSGGSASNVTAVTGGSSSGGGGQQGPGGGNQPPSRP